IFVGFVYPEAGSASTERSHPRGARGPTRPLALRPASGASALGRCARGDDGLGPALSLGALQEVRFDEAIEVAVEHRLHVPDLVLGAEILHELIGLHDVAADLVAPGDLPFGGLVLGLLLLTF